MKKVPHSQPLPEHSGPLFPTFSELKLEHKPIIDTFNERFFPYSDFNFTSLYSWNTDGSTEFSLLHGNLVIRQPDYLTGQPVLSILGEERIDESLAILLESNHSLKLIPKATIEAIKDHHQFTVIDDRDNHDYIYDLAEITELAGGKYKKLRNKINAFATAFEQDIQVEHLSELNVKEKEEFISLFDEWAKAAKQPAKDSASERIAIRRLLNDASELGLLFTTVRYKSELVAFSINEILPKGYAICHFEKAIFVDDGIFPFVARESARALSNKNVHSVNWEQDLGINGLRHSKTKWRPKHFHEKYSVTLNKPTGEKLPLPHFPDFESVKLEHREAIETILSDAESYSDFNFTNLFIWNIDGSTMVSSLNKNLIVKIMNYNAEYLVLTMDGKNDVDKTARELLAYAKSQPSLSDNLEYIHEHIVDQLTDEKFYKITEERHNFDYIIQLSKETKLSGRESKSRRKLIHYFENSYDKDTEVKIVDIHKPEIQKQMIDLFDRWAEDKNLPDSDKNDEKAALERLFLVANDAMQVTAIYDHDTLIGFTVDELHESKCAIGHFMKADISYRGIFQYLEYHAALNLVASGMEYINIEQDLGIEQLRASKLGHRPHELLKKFTVATRT